MRSLFSRTCLHLHMCLWLLAGLAGTQLFAQSATVSGQVFDSTGAVVSGATVTLLRPSTGVKLIAVTDAKGLFILPPVAPGNYEATVSAPSFAVWRETGVVVEIGQQKVINANLSVGAASTTVSVTGGDRKSVV